MRLFLLILFVLSTSLLQAQPAVLSRVLRNYDPSPDSWDTLTITIANSATFKSRLASHSPSTTVLQEYPLDTGRSILLIRCRHRQFHQQILPIPGLLFADKNPGRPKDEMAIGDLDLSVNNITLAQNRFPASTGEDLTISIREDRFDTADIDLHNRILYTPLASSLYSTHASIMATIIGGAGNSFATGKGVAPAATLTSFNYNVLLPEPDSVYAKYGITVQNHSYGTTLGNYYGNEAMAHDVSAIHNPTLLHVFSAGNAGDQGLSTLTGNFKMAKNVLTVGATDSFGKVSLLSSKGPAYDGRIKPDLVAFGQDGSSGSAALVSGSALLLQQALRQKDGSVPFTDLLRAILLTTTNSDTPPNYIQGFGALDANRALECIRQNHYLRNNLQPGESRNILLPIPEGLRNLRITLSWTDPAAAPNAPKALVNDLDLSLITPNNATIQPWILNPAPDSLLQPAHRGRDSLDNNEQIGLETPTAGNYIIHIEANDLKTSQDFAIAWSADTAETFTWTSPLATTPLTPNKPALLRWQTTLDDDATLDYSLDKGLHWINIGRTLSLATKNIYWPTPDTTAFAILRMTIGNKTFYSDSFAIAPIPVLEVGFNCPDSLFLYWNAIPKTAAYRLFQLGNRHLEPFATTADTSLILAKADHPSLFYAVTPILQGDGVPPQTPGSHTIDYTTQGVDCYIKTFTADLQTDATASLILTLGTDYQLHDIRIEKHGPDGYHLLDPPRPLPDLQWTLTDNHLTPGLNRYRATIDLDNGRSITSDEQIVYYLAGRRFIVYPIPLVRPAPVSILADGPVQATFQLFDILGRKISETRLIGNPALIPTTRLAPGIYAYRILTPNSSPEIGKLIVQ